MDSVKNIMKEVEYEEKAAEEAKAEAALTCSDIIAKADASKKALIQAEEINNKVVNFAAHKLFSWITSYIYLQPSLLTIWHLQLAKKVNAVKDDLATKIEAFQLRVTQMLDDGDRALAVLEEVLLSVN